MGLDVLQPHLLHQPILVGAMVSLHPTSDTEASMLARLIVANARMQSKIFKLLRPEQQKKLSDLERTQGALTSEGK
jgi:hypothetical protein